MSLVFKQHLQKFIAISDSEFETVLSYFENIQVKKKNVLMREGDICDKHYFVLNGCLRKYFVNEKGIEQTTEFAIENWWMTDNMAYEHQLKTEFYIQTVERSDILVITNSAQEALLKQVPVLERYFRFVYQRAYAASQMRIKFLYTYSKEDFYFHFLKKYPDFVQRIPQYLLASFLGFSPEYLSEIRAKRIS